MVGKEYIFKNDLAGDCVYEVLMYCPRCNAITPHLMIEDYYDVDDIVTSSLHVVHEITYICKNCGYKEREQHDEFI